MREYGPKLGIIILCIVSFIIFPIYWVSKGTKYDYTIQKEEMNVELKNDGSIEVNENLVIQPHTMISSIEKDLFPISLKENKRYNCYDCIRSASAYVDGVESTVEDLGVTRKEKNMKVISFDPTTRKFTMKLSYTVDSRAVKRYTSLAAFGLNFKAMNTKVNQLKIQVKIPEDGTKKYYVKDTTTGSSIAVTRKSPQVYQMTQKNLTENTQTSFIIGVDTEVLNQTNIMKEKSNYDILNFDYDEQTREHLQFISKNKNNLPLVYYIIFSTTIYVFLEVIRYKRNYVKKIKDHLIIPYSQGDIKVLPPLASKMISGKSKDFALSLILTLQERGNIGIKADGTIIYMHDQHLSDYEHEFLKVFFQKKKLNYGDSMTITDLSQKVNKNLDTKTCFIQDFGIVRDLATEALYKNRIYDKNLGNFMNAFEKYGFVNMIGAIILLVGYLLGWIRPETESIFPIVATLFGLSMVILVLPLDLHTIWKYIDKKVKKVLQLGYFLLLLILLFPVIGYLLTTHECYLLLVLIFALVHFLLFRFYDEELLTKYGRMEYLRLSGLRHFCNHYYDYEAQAFETHPYYKYYLKYIVAFGDTEKILIHYHGVLKILGKQLDTLF